MTATCTSSNFLNSVYAHVSVRPISPFESSRETKVTATHQHEDHDEHEQVLEMPSPPMPGLGMSPITPKTPGTQFPITPTSSTMGMEGMSFGYDGKDRELDPTTLFVGGLEMHGPSAWDEERVANLFAKYGGLQSVKVVRPRKCRQAAKISVGADIPSSELPGRLRLRQVQQ